MAVGCSSILHQFTRDASHLIHRVKEQICGELEKIDELEQMVEKMTISGFKDTAKHVEDVVLKKRFFNAL